MGWETPGDLARDRCNTGCAAVLDEFLTLKLGATAGHLMAAITATYAFRLVLVSDKASDAVANVLTRL